VRNMLEVESDRLGVGGVFRAVGTLDGPTTYLDRGLADRFPTVHW